MHSINEIIALNDEASVKADREKLQPYVAVKDQDEGVFKCPNFGYYRPQGWEEVGCHFVDISGFGSETEPALTAKQFLSKVKEGNGYAITESYQFQAYITEFKKK